MATTRLPKERIDFLTNQIAKVLEKNPDFEVLNANELRAIFRNFLTENLQEEIDIERDVLEALKKHGQAIYEQDADFQELFRKGKQILARQKRFQL